jgi:hypothetical protein
MGKIHCLILRVGKIAFIFAVLLSAGALIVMEACTTVKDEKRAMNEEEYFSSPQEAVPRITEMLKLEDFKTLAKYYDLSGSDIPPADLESGAFFVQRERPEVAHPAGFWRHKHPFPPGFTYAGMHPGARENVHVIRVEISIDQGAEAPNQSGYAQFQMIKSDMGWQILPDPVNDPPPVAQ